jgi:hypothetical protein
MRNSRTDHGTTDRCRKGGLRTETLP